MLCSNLGFRPRIGGGGDGTTASIMHHPGTGEITVESRYGWNEEHPPNTVVYSADGQVIRKHNIASHPGVRTALTTNGRLVVWNGGTDPNEPAVWCTERKPPGEGFDDNGAELDAAGGVDDGNDRDGLPFFLSPQPQMENNGVSESVLAAAVAAAAGGQLAVAAAAGLNPDGAAASNAGLAIMIQQAAAQQAQLGAAGATDDDKGSDDEDSDDDDDDYDEHNDDPAYVGDADCVGLPANYELVSQRCITVEAPSADTNPPDTDSFFVTVDAEASSATDRPGLDQKWGTDNFQGDRLVKLTVKGVEVWSVPLPRVCNEYFTDFTDAQPDGVLHRQYSAPTHFNIDGAGRITAWKHGYEDLRRGNFENGVVVVRDLNGDWRVIAQPPAESSFIHVCRGMLYYAEYVKNQSCANIMIHSTGSGEQLGRCVVGTDQKPTLVGVDNYDNLWFTLSWKARQGVDEHRGPYAQYESKLLVWGPTGGLYNRFGDLDCEGLRHAVVYDDILGARGAFRQDGKILLQPTDDGPGVMVL